MYSIAGKLELNYFDRFLRSRLESTLLGGTFRSRCQHWMTADDAGCFYRAIRGYRHLDFYRARQIQFRREFGHDGLDEAFNWSFFLGLGGLSTHLCRTNGESESKIGRASC